MEINQMSELAHLNSVKKGFYEGVEFNLGEKLMLIVSEVSEALEADRKGNRSGWNITLSGSKDNKEWDKMFEKVIKDTFEDELADIVIRIGDLCGYMGIDLDYHVKAKMKYNENRPHKHGKKY